MKESINNKNFTVMYNVIMYKIIDEIESLIFAGKKSTRRATKMCWTVMNHQSINKFINEKLQSCILMWKTYKASVIVVWNKFYENLKIKSIC